MLKSWCILAHSLIDFDTHYCNTFFKENANKTTLIALLVNLSLAALYLLPTPPRRCFPI